MQDKTQRIPRIAKGWGPRYGRKVREKVASVMADRQASTECPFCKFNTIKRQAAGIWGCKKCGKVFAGRAYTPEFQKSFTREEAREEVIIPVEE